jgi:hypothetical protein
VHLKGDPRAWLDLGPEGLILAQAPSRELVLAMFELADALNAGVYGERLQRYRSIEDWERRTRLCATGERHGGAVGAPRARGAGRPTGRGRPDREHIESFLDVATLLPWSGVRMRLPT